MISPLLLLVTSLAWGADKKPQLRTEDFQGRTADQPSRKSSSTGSSEEEELRKLAAAALSGGTPKINLEAFAGKLTPEQLEALKKDLETLKKNQELQQKALDDLMKDN